MAESTSEEMLETIMEIGNHIRYVQQNLEHITNELQKRSVRHDASKYKEDELKEYVWGPRIPKGLKFGSDEEKAARKKVLKASSAVPLHHQCNDHHPQHYEDITDMRLVALIEMVCDWKASHKAHRSKGHWTDSISVNIETFNFTEAQIWVIKEVAELLGD